MPEGDESLPKTVEHALQERVHADARRLRGTLPGLAHGLIAGVLATHLLATAALTWIVLAEGFPYPVMYVVMGLVLWLAAMIRFTAWLSRRRVSAALLLAANVLAQAFWVLVLLDRVPARPLVTARAAVRPDLPILYVPIALYSLAILGLLAHALVPHRSRRAGG